MLKILVIALSFAAAAAAQSPLFAQVGDPFPDGMGQAAGAADFEGDGDVDVFTSAGVFLNVNGFFTPGPKMPPGFVATTNVRSIAVAELTGDGRVDILIGIVGPKLYAAPSAGGAFFALSGTAFAGAPLTLSELCVADFDGDGDGDVIGASSSSGTPLWQLYLNDGLGTFTAAPAARWPAAPTEASWVAAGDFDGDGWIDAFATSQSGALWRRNLGMGFFGPTIVLGSTLVADDGAIGDFDGDGDDDVYLSTVPGNDVVHTGTPTGLVAGTPGAGGILGPPPLGADLDGDGDADLLRSVVQVSGGSDGALQLRLGGPGGLGPPITIGQVAFGLGNPMPFRGLVSFDVEGDGDPDLGLVTGVAPPALLINGGQAGVVFAPQAVPFQFRSLYAPPRDVDGDGDADLIHGAATGNVTLTTARNDGRGVFAGPVPAGSYTNFLGRAVWGDLDNDGDQDLWATWFLQGATGTAVLNDGTGVFSTGPSVNNPGPTSALAIGDFDGDADLDIVVGRGLVGFPPTPFQPVLIRAVITGTTLSYMPPGVFGFQEAITDIEVLDAEPDGDLDLLVATAGLGGVPAPPRFYLNGGTGNFTQSLSMTATTASTVAAGDLNGDGLVDAVLGGQSWLQTVGGFSLFGSHPVPLGIISLADLDGNGTLDILDSSGRWYPGLGTGAFAAPINIVPNPVAPSGAASPKPVAIDLDSDGDLDFVTSEGVVYFNLTRHAGRTSLVEGNHTVSMSVFGAPAAPWLLATSATPAAPVAYPPFGTLFLDQASAVIIASGAIPAIGRSDLSFFLAPQAIPGFTLAWQALVGGSLTNGFDTVVLP